jgi:hypothetical protein
MQLFCVKKNERGKRVTLNPKKSIDQDDMYLKFT